MYKQIISASVLTASLLFSGCGNDETSCRIDVQQAIDEGDFTTAITKLEGECSTTFSDSDKYFYLASAYMGQSGFGVSDAVSMVVTASDSTGDTFSAFMQSVNDNKSVNALPLLDKSAGYFLMSIDPNATIADCTNVVLDRTQREENACLYVGFNQAITTATSVTYLTTDVDSLVASIDGTGTTPDDMKASLDAIAWATSSVLPNGSTITPSDVNISGTVYKHLEVLQNGKTFYRLASSISPDATNGSTVVTSGYCDVNGSTTPCEGIEDVDGSIYDANLSLACYACPVDFGDGDTKDMTQLLVDALNGGTDAISSVIDDADIQQSIDEFKTDMNVSADANVTIQDILDYLNQ
ncbi:hypothetical protein [Sulfurimonas marina]|uniref:Uncharacterized protein n=1 Tax=Sulfurimonas marina TaxID=2590551 RepID=A0A7M1AY54_9BACT|nr:hypothetical protein [Sulfurimonas marina]QOP42256.1 hypothetical protein FJR03_11105 [Sulfurimonas marina]